jgi:hypothetical protein
VEVRIRLVLLNFLYNLLQEYSIEEIRFLRSPINLLYAHLVSPTFLIFHA